MWKRWVCCLLCLLLTMVPVSAEGLESGRMEDEPTGISLVVPNNWRYNSGRSKKGKASFYLCPVSGSASDRTGYLHSINCFRYPIAALSYVKDAMKDDPAKIATAVISKTNTSRITLEDVEEELVGDTLYYHYASDTTGDLGYTDYLVHVRDGQVYLFTTTMPHGYALFPDFRRAVESVTYGVFPVPEGEEGGGSWIWIGLAGVLLAAAAGLFLRLRKKGNITVLREETVYCPHCGMPQKAENSFCVDCGWRIRE